ncbi:MAG: CBS domain-containing protein [Desulfurococcales archaeon]|nr:CBS domain-containing protein [Desulfurococcales archaeon]
MFENIALKNVDEIKGNTAPVLDKDYSLAEVLDEIDKYKTDRAILTEKGKLRGILTLRDVIFKLGTTRTKQATPSGMHASSFMTEPVKYVDQESPLLQALRFMDEAEITSVPVTDKEGKPTGIVSRWELASLLSESVDAADIRAREIMKTFPVSIDLQARILHVRQLLLQHNLSTVPVMEDGEFLGVIGVDEIALVFLKYYELSRGEPKRITPLKYVIVGDAIRLRPPTVDPDASVAEAASKMVSHRYRVVVVVDNGKPVGYISGLELARLILKGA